MQHQVRNQTSILNFFDRALALHESSVQRLRALVDCSDEHVEYAAFQGVLDLLKITWRRLPQISLDDLSVDCVALKVKYLLLCAFCDLPCQC